MNVQNISSIITFKLHYELINYMMRGVKSWTDSGGYLNGIFDGMIISYYILAVNSEGVIQTYPNNAPGHALVHCCHAFDRYE